MRNLQKRIDTQNKGKSSIKAEVVRGEDDVICWRIYVNGKLIIQEKYDEWMILSKPIIADLDKNGLDDVVKLEPHMNSMSTGELFIFSQYKPGKFFKFKLLTIPSPNL